jgi:hypothetical protein
MKINKQKGTSLTQSVSMATASAVTPFVVTSHIPETKENQSEQLQVVTKHSQSDNRFLKHKYDIQRISMVNQTKGERDLGPRY